VNQRLREFDFLRAFAALSVIAIHSTSGYVVQTTSGFVWNQLMRYAVPLFVILSGFLLYFRDKSKPPLTYPFFLKKRLKKVLIPYLLWTVIYVCYSSSHILIRLITNEPSQFVALLAKHILRGTGFTHLYFVLIVIQLYAIYPILRDMLQHHPKLILYGSLGLTLISQTAIYFNQINLIVLPNLGIPYVSLFPIWLFFFIFGMYAALQKEVWDHYLLGKENRMFLIWLAAFGLLFVDSQFTKTAASSIKPTVMIYTMASYFLFYTLALKWGNTKKRMGVYLDWLSKHSFFIFLIHPLFLNFLVYHEKQIAVHLWKGNIGMYKLYLTVSLIALTVSYMASKTRLFGPLGSIYDKKNRA
jgi:surface polysaccharide O-acyltransferase-like enzyme